MIKSTTLVFGTLLVLAPVRRLNAQTQKGMFEFAAGFGLISAYQINVALGGDRQPVLIDRAYPILGASGKYFFSKRLALGLDINVQHITGASNGDWVIRTNGTAFSYKMTNVNIAPEITFLYVNKRYFRFYTFAGVAYVHSFTTYYNNGANHYIVYPNNVSFQYTPIGIRVGGDFAFYVEMGIGYKGLLNGGFAYTIGKKKAEL